MIAAPLSPTSVASLRARLEGLHAWLGPLGLRLLLAWEYGEAGLRKLRGDNWFGDIQSAFPFPFDRVSPAWSWTLATWVELVGAVLLAFGFATRATAFALFGLTVVATAAVHWPDTWSSPAELWRGYAITDAGYGNFKLPLLFLAMLLPLVLGGAGRLGVDALLARRAPPSVARVDARTWAIACGVAAVFAAWLAPAWGATLAGIALMLFAWSVRRQG